MGMMFKATVVAVVAVALSALLSLVIDGKARLYYPTPGFSLEAIPDLNGKVAIVTGANTGLGYATMVALVEHNAVVYVGARSPAKAQDAKERAAKDLGLSKPKTDELIKVLPVGLDLSSQKSVKAFVSAFKKEDVPLNILINNAGVASTEYYLTEDGFESMFATNHLGHYTLTLQLMDELERGQPSRVVSVSSLGHRFTREDATFEVSNINDEKNFEATSWYGYSKLANILFASELDKKLAGKEIYVNSAHPGGVKTDLTRGVKEKIIKNIHQVAYDALDAFMSMMFMSPADGALTQLFLATSPKVEQEGIRGQYYIPTARNGKSCCNKWYHLAAGMTEQALDEKLAKTLWEVSVKATGVDL
mmetsp:Transcript_4863/g.9136  ORF Transcript_4863/g.9136 Transcript_4863/m.9136 type:complete len:362 (+) Transcript_4863:123-1208(+)